MDPVTKLCKKITNHEGRGKEFCKHSSFACKELQAKYLKLEEEEEIWLAEKRRYILKLTDYSLDKTALKREKNLLKTELDKFLKEKNEMLQIINDISHDRKVLEVKLEEISRENEILQTKFDKVLKEKNEMIKTTKDKSHILESSDYSVDKSFLEVKLEEMERKNTILQTQLEEKVQIIKGKSQVIRQFLERQNKVAKCNYMHNLGKVLWSFNSAKDKIDVYCAKQQNVLQKLEKVEQTCNNCRSTAEKDRQNYEQRIKVLENDLLNLRFLNDQLNYQNSEMKHECENLKQELRKSKKGNKDNRKSSSKESGEILLPPTPDTPFSDENSIRGDFEEDTQHTTSTVESGLEPVINALDINHISIDKKMISKSRKTPLKNEPDNLDGKSEKRAISSQCTQDTVKDSINKSVSRKRIGRKRSSQHATFNIPGNDLDSSTVKELTNKSVHGKDQKILEVKVIKDAKSSEVINSPESISEKSLNSGFTQHATSNIPGIDLDNSTVQELTNKSVHGKDQKILVVKVIKDAKSSEVINSPESISEKSLNSGFLLDGVTVHNMQRSLSDENEKVFKTDSLNTNMDCIKDLPVLEDEDSSPVKESPNISVNFIKQLLPVVEDKVALSDNKIECTSKSSGHTVNRAFTKPSQLVDRADLSSGNYLGDIDAKRVMRSDGWSPPYNPETDNFEHTLHMLTITPKVLSPLKEVSHSGKVKQRPSIFSPIPSDSSNQSETKVFSEEIGKEPVGTSIGDVFIQEDAHVTRDKNCDRENSYSQSSNIPRKIHFEDTITGSQGISENEGNVKTACGVKTRKLKTKKDHKSLKKIVINEEGQINHNKANYNESSKVFEETLTISVEDNLELRVNDNSLPLDLSLKNVKSILGVEKQSCSKENNSKINSKRKKDSSKVEASLLETTSGFNFEKSFNTCDPLKRTWDESELEPTESLNCVPLKKWPKTSPLAHYSPDTTTNITTKTVDSDFPHDRSEVKIKKVSREIKALNSSYSPDSIFTSPRSEHFTDFSQVSLRSPTAMDRYELRQSIKLPKSIQYSACKKRPNSNKAKKNSFLTPVKEVVKKPNFVKNGSVKSASNRKNILDSKSRETRTILAKNRNCDTATSRSVSPSPESMRNYNISSDYSKGKCGYCDSVTCIGLEEKGCKRKLTEDPQSTVDPKHFLLKRLKVSPDFEEEIHRAKQNSTLEIDQRLLPQERLGKSLKTSKDFTVPIEMNVDCEHTRCLSLIKNKSSSEQSVEKIKTSKLSPKRSVGESCLPGRSKQLVETQELCLSNNESSKHVISDSYLSRKSSSKLESNQASKDCSKIVGFKSYSSSNDGSNQVIVLQQDSIIKRVKSINKIETIAIESNSSNSSLSLNGDDAKLDEDCLVIDVDEEDWLSVSDTGKNSPWVEDQTMSCEAEFTMKLTNEGANPLSKLYQNTLVTQPIDTKSNTSRNMEPYGARTQLSYNPIIPSFKVPSYQPLPEAMYKYEEKLVKTNTDFSYPENRVLPSSLNSSESQNIPSPINECVINFYNNVQADSSKSNNPEAVSEDKCSFPKLSNNSAFKLMSLHQLIPRGDKTLVTENVLRTVIKKHKENLEDYRKKNILIGRSTDNDAQGKATTKELTTKVLEIFMPLVRKDVTCLSDINRAVDRVEEYEIRVIVRAVMVFLKDAASQALIGHHHAQWMLDCDLPELPNKKSPIVHPKIQISYMFLYLAIERFTKDRSCEEKKKFVDEELHFIEEAFHGVVNEFTDPNWIFWLNLAFLYTLLARNFGFVVRVRQLMYDMFYCFTRRANVVAYAMLKVWSFVLPIRPIEFFSNDPLFLCIILQLTAVPPDVNTRSRIIASKLQELMSRKYRFRFNTVVPDQLLNTCLERLGQSGVHEALVLLAKRQPRDWFLKRPVHQLMEVVEGWSEQKEDCGDVRAVAAIKALCATLRPYQPTSIQQEITKLFNIFVKILSDESTPMWMQEVIVLNFCLLSRVNQSKCLELITKWRPTEISEEVVDQILIDVVGKRPPSWWGKNKMAHQFLSQ